MQERERFEKVAGGCWRIAMTAIIVALLMIPAAIAMRFWDLSGGLSVLGVEVVLACWLAWLRLKDKNVSLAEVLTTRGSAGSHLPPLVLWLVGCVFWGPGLYTIVTAAEPVDPQPDQIKLVEQVWFGATVLLLGLGLSGLGLSGWLARSATARAVARLTDQIRQQPARAQRYFDRGLLLVERGDLRWAIEDFSKVIQLAPENVAAYLERGDLHYRLKDYQQAIADYSAAIDRDPQNAEAYFKRGWVYDEDSQPDRAEADLAKSQELAETR